MVKATTNFKGIFPTYKIRKDGTRITYWYDRATMQRIRGQPGEPEFLADYTAIRRAIARHGVDTFNTVSRSFTNSIEFQQKLAPATQREYKRMLAKAEDRFGDMPLGALEDPRVRKEFLDWREQVAQESGEREADNRLSAISAMWTWAVDRGLLPVNYLKGFKRLYHSNRAEKIWLADDIRRFMAVAPIELQRALIIALHSGQRQGDILRLPWSAYDGSSITLRQGKSKRRGVLGPILTIPCTQTLRRLLDLLPKTSPLVLTTKTGRAFRKRYFAALWKRSSERAGLVDLHFHDLRGTAVTMLSEAGCTPQQIATITGHSLASVGTILDKYLARTRSLAEQAIFNWENSPRTEFANQLQTDSLQSHPPQAKLNGGQ